MSEDEVSEIFSSISKSKDDTGTSKVDSPKSKSDAKKKPPKPKKGKFPPPKRKKTPPKKPKEDIECGNCRESQKKDPTIKKRDVEWADGSAGSDYLCDECFALFDTTLDPKIKEKLENLTPEEKSNMFKLSDEDMEKMEKEAEATPEPESLKGQIQEEAKVIAKEAAAKTVAEPEAEEDTPKKPKPPKKKAPPKPPKKKKAPQVTDEDVEKADPEPKKPKRKVLKKSKEEVSLKASIKLTELQMENLLGEAEIDFGEDLEDDEEGADKQTIVIVGRGKRGKSSLAFTAQRGMMDRDNAPHSFSIEERFDGCDHEEPTHGCQKCRPTIFYAISMDGKTFKPAKRSKSPTKVIHVIDGRKHYRESTDVYRLLSSSLTQRYIDHLLLIKISADCKKRYGIEKPDFIVIDDLQILQSIYNHAMRQYFQLGVYDQVDWKKWTLRNQYVNTTHQFANELCNESLIYCTYEKWQDKEREDKSKFALKSPAWAGDIEKKTDTLIEVSYVEAETMEFFAQVKSAKDPYWSYTKQRVTTDYQGRGGLWNILKNAPETKQLGMSTTNA